MEKLDELIALYREYHAKYPKFIVITDSEYSKMLMETRNVSTKLKDISCLTHYQGIPLFKEGDGVCTINNEVRSLHVIYEKLGIS